MGVCALAFGLGCAAPSAAHAVASGPSLALNPTAATPGSSFTISGVGFRPAETISLYWNGAAVAMLPASSTGAFAVRATLGRTMAAGARSVVARGSAGDQAGTTFTVLSAAPPATATAPPAPPAPPAPAQPSATATAPPAPAQPSATATAPPAPAQPSAPVPAQAAGIPTSGTTSNGCPITPDQAAAEQSLLMALNQHRAAVGVAPLRLNQTLSLASRQQSCDMFQHQQLNHTGSDGSSPFDRMRAVGVTFATAGENIGMAGGYGLTGGVAAVDSGMMAEPLTAGNHHWNIVNAAYTHVGLGVIYANGQVWLTEDFIG